MTISDRIGALVQQEADEISQDLKKREDSILLARELCRVCQEMIDTTPEAGMLEAAWSRASLDVDEFGRRCVLNSFSRVWVEDTLVSAYRREQKKTTDDTLRGLLRNVVEPAEYGLPRLSVYYLRVMFERGGDIGRGSFNCPDADYVAKDGEAKIRDYLADTIAAYLARNRHFYKSFRDYQQAAQQRAQNLMLVKFFVLALAILFVISMCAR